MKKKSILFIADIVPYPANTGIKIRTYNILRQLSRVFNVYLIAFNHKILISEKKQLDDAKRSLELFCEEVHIFEIPSDRNRLTYYWCLARNIFSIKPYRTKRYWSNECVKIIKDLSARVFIHIVHFDKTELYEYSKFLSKKPCVVTNHNVESKLMKHRATYEINFLRRMYAFIQYFKTEQYEKKTLGRVSA